MFHFKKADQGFTLIELLIVLTIIALASSIVMPNMWAQLDRSKVNSETKQVKDLLRYTQNKVYYSNQPFLIEVDGHHISIKDSKNKQLKKVELSYIYFESKSINIALRNPYKTIVLKASVENREVNIKL